MFSLCQNIKRFDVKLKILAFSVYNQLISQYFSNRLISVFYFWHVDRNE